MASGWAREGAVQEQIDDTVNDAVARARRELAPGGVGLTHCEECGEPIPERRRELIPGVRLCVACQAEADEAERAAAGFNRRASKDSQLR
ncbi:DksA/TraR family C4-type zinc finger protein [Salinisphaera sp.]|uniref:DksA/TraR family C4-type zinc finger protein n=1 Tax=Salinisphaera sp. TaxID=1914330 RepID=UPI002D789B07|nr:DksA/TraR family C4-type zinc finger protein [Salinisphaera sp.]HET7313040.1 DksA/TraR family C4-type zinc finger protein [Salinisphaera sp.]